MGVLGELNYYRRYVGDYLRDTSSLSLLEHGAYNILLDHYYAEEKPLSADIDRIYRIARAMMPEERRAVDKVLFDYFQKRDDGWHNARADEELSKAGELIDQMREQGRLRVEARWAKHRKANGQSHDTGADTGFDTGADTVTVTGSDTPTNHQPPISSLQPPTTTLQLKPPPANAGESKPAVSPCPHAEIIKLYAEHLPMGRQVRPPWNGSRSAHLQARWREDRQRQGLPWWGEFFAYCAESAFLTGKKPSRKPGDKPFCVSLDWIVEPTNFQKIIEGAYDD